MEKKMGIQGNLRTYLRWPFFLTILLLVMNVSIYFVDQQAGLIMSVYVLIYLIIALSLYFYKNSALQGDLVHYAANYGQVQKQLLREMALPYAVLDIDGHLLWGNDEFMDVISGSNSGKKSISNVIPEITKAAFPKEGLDEEIHVVIEERYYKAVMRKMLSDGFDEGGIWEDTEIASLSESNTLITLYLYDETEILTCIRENKEQQMVIGLLYIDNYEEALESIDEVRRSLLIALVDRKINKFMQSIDAIIKKLEKDKYIFLFKQKYLQQLQNNKFSILEEVKAVNIGNDMSVTLSLGMGVNDEAYLRAYDFARASIDLALGRGGDQAVIKNGEKIFYYGGKSIQIEKNTRVKARVKAHALKELVEAKERVVIMGHKLGDVDSFGAAIGIYRIAKTLGKKANIVINDVTTSVKPIRDRFLNNVDYEEDMFLTGTHALDLVDLNTLLVIVDVNKPNITECEELLALTKTIVILDHHRQTDEAIENAVLSYIEPYASSTCEMVAEVLQYIGEGLKLRQNEADAMYSGIMIDTDNFLTKTGVRTFEAAAYLRRNGADVTRIRKGFRSSIVEFKTRAEAIRNTEIYLDYYAITECPNEGLDSPTIIGAQVANELLDINNIKASFVLTEFSKKIYVSARSIDELNVQVVMEKLGGGGHMSAAGTQFLDCTMEEAGEIIRNTLDTMNKEGEL
jgi:cyclic-di-AMP phosphodiesterase